MTTLWLIVVIAGPVMLGSVLLYAYLSNKLKRDQAPEEVSDHASRQLYRELDAEDKERDG